MMLPHVNDGKNYKNPSESESLFSFLTFLVLGSHRTKLIWSLSPLTSVKLNQVIHLLHSLKTLLYSMYFALCMTERSLMVCG